MGTRPGRVWRDGVEGRRRGALLQFGLIGVIVLSLLMGGTALASRTIGTDEAIRDARDETELLARAVIQPNLNDAMVAGDESASSDVDRAIRAGVLDGTVARVKLWTGDGRIVYSDEPGLIGQQFALGAQELSVLRGGSVEAEVSDLSRPENSYERNLGKLLEVYVTVTTPGGTPLLFEAYFRYDGVSSAARRIWSQFVPVVIAGLLLLELAQFPLAWRLTSRLRRGEREREQLLRQAIEASETERRRIASDLHDGVVQDLAGVSYALAGVKDTLARAGDERTAGTLQIAADDVRRGVQALRSLLVEIYPPNLREAGLSTALQDLTAGLAGRGIESEVVVDEALSLDEGVEALIFRTAQEALRNVARHASAHHVKLTVVRVNGSVALDVIDDGVGFTKDRVTAVPGHVGLRVLDDLATRAGADLHVTSVEGRGTRVHLEVPVR